MKPAIVRCLGSIGLMAMLGCVGTGEVIPLHLRAVPAAADKAGKPAEAVRVAIGAFEDGRTYQTGLGVRTHLWGGVSYFDVPGSKPAEAVAQALAEYLAAKGWQVVKADGSDRTDVTIAGKLQDLFVHAKSRVGFTEITTRTKLAIQATNSVDGSVVRLTLNGAGSEDVFWFDPEDVQTVLNEVLADSFGKLAQDTMIVEKKLRLKSQ